MRKLGSVELYNTFKKMNTSIKFKQPVMRERVVNNRDAEDEVFVANNMEEHQAVMRNLNKSVGHEVSDDVVWGKVMEILRPCKLVQLCWPYNCSF
jgi:glutamate synthase domain-containing protein 3